jgi:hypothetical protein
MQKVEGSNPFSRFASNPLQFGRLVLPSRIPRQCIFVRLRKSAPLAVTVEPNFV